MGLSPLTLLPLPFVHQFRDRHGKLRYYLRRRRQKLIPLSGTPGTPEFLASYEAAMASAGVKLGKPPLAGSINALAVSWYATASYRQLSPVSQRDYRNILERFRAEHGGKPVRMLEAMHIRKMMAAKSDTPAAANHLLRILRLLMAHAVEDGWRKDDPTTGVRKLKEVGTGFVNWSDEEIATFQVRWPVGTKPGLALALLLYTGQRRGDVVRMGRQHLRAGGVAVRQMKTKADLFIPIHADLQRHLDAIPAGELTFLMTEHGKPYSAAGFTNVFRRWAAAAGLPTGRSPHGLRKAAARRMAEAGCTAHQIASITGHKTLAEVERYTRAVDQERLARSAILRMTPDKPRTNVANRFCKSG